MSWRSCGRSSPALPATAGIAINVNTAPPEVLAATIDGLSLTDANRITAARLGKPFQTLAEFRSRVPAVSRSAKRCCA
jgi:type II secretory pathway component PulK